MLHYKKFFFIAFLLFTIHHFSFAQNSNILNINTDTEELTSVKVQVYFYLGLFQDSIVHLVWENYDHNNIRQVVVESSNDGINFRRCSGAVIANLFDIHILNYPQELDYNNTVLKSSESGNTRFIYNDVVPHADFKLQARWYRIKMHANSGVIYTSQTVCTNDSPSMMPTKTGGQNEKTLNNHSEYTWIPGQKAGCSPVQTPPTGSTPTGSTNTYYGDCCYWVESQYQGASAILTDCGGDSYAWCCNNVPGAAACASGYVSDPCCVHYCNEYNSCSCHPWECCSSSTVNTWVVTESSTYPPISVSVSASPSSICVGQCANLSASGASSYTWVGGNLPGSSSTGANISVCPTITTTYTVTGTDIHNCTSTASVTITLNPPTISGTLSLCINATTQLTGSGTPATSNPWISTNTGIATVNNTGLVTGISAGTSTITYTNDFGCTNSVIITVKPTPTIAVPANITVCNGADITGSSFTSNPPGGTFTWSNTNAAIGLATGGTGDVPSFNATNTGTAPISGTITVTPTVNSCIGTPSSYTITVNPTPTVAVPADITVCNGSSVSGTNFTSPTSGATFSWTNSNTDIGLAGAGTGNISLFTATNTGNDPISATITVVPSANSCTGTSSSYAVMVNPTPMVIVPADTTICDGTVIAASVFTSPTAGTTFTWSNPATTIGLAGSGTGNVPAFTATNNGTVPVTATITVTPAANNCTGTPSSYSITVNPLPVITFTPMPYVCFTSPVFTLSQASPAGGTYSGTGISGTTYDPSVAGIGTHTITYDYTNPATGCSNTGSTQIVINGLLTVTVSPNNPFICEGNSVVLTASGATSYTWQPAASLSSATGANVLATPTTTTIYSVLGSNPDGCMGSATVAVGIYAVPVMVLTPSPQKGCIPLEVTFGYGPVGPIDTNTMSWNFGDLSSPFNTSTETTPTHVYNNSGHFPVYLSAHTTDGCPVSVVDSVFAFIVPIADFYYNPPVAYSDNPRLDFIDLSFAANTWLWNFGDPLSYNNNLSDLQNPFHIFSDSGTYVVQLVVFSDQSCSDTIEKPLIIYPSIIIYIPNAFTPNLDGRNETFKPVITGSDESQYEFFIYDRWGRLEFHTNDYNEGWDGKNNGKPCELGVYVYLVKYTSVTGKDYKVKGLVTLIR